MFRVKQFLALSCLFFSIGQAQFFNPGDLSSAHYKYLNGFSKCTKCHTGNRKKACLKCHTDIGKKLTSKSGYHYLKRNKKCYTCHGEHKGKKHNLRDLDRIGFQHKDTGWPLKGKHQNLKCKECHIDKRINAVTKKLTKKTTFLKNSQDCNSCHADPHEPTYDKKCEECHNAQDWFYFDFAKDAQNKKPLKKRPANKVTPKKK